jgi:hypothetical protein
MADNTWMRGGEVGSSAKVTQNPFAAEITSSSDAGETGVQVKLAPNPVTEGPVPAITDTSNGARSEIRGVPPKFTFEGPASTDTSGNADHSAVPGGIVPGSMRPPSSVDTSRNR